MSADTRLEEAKMHARGLARRMTDAGFHVDVGDARVRAAAELAARAASELAPEASPFAELIAQLRDELACAGASFASARESLKDAGRRPTHSPSDW